MPVYEYRCEECGERFEQTETLAEHKTGKPSCPKCKSKNVSRSFSTFQVRIPMISTGYSDRSRPPVPTDRDHFG
jgi:putative FmdB family regulatory protein